METTLPSITDSVIQAAGGILHRETPSGDEVLIVHRKRYGDWTLPKGKLKPGESFTEAALREVKEETGCSVHLEEYLGAIGYQVGDLPKVVLFWRMSVKEQLPIEDTGEVQEVTWLQIADAMQRLTHDAERAFLSRVFCNTRLYQSPQELSLPPRTSRSFPWFGGAARSHARLSREFEVFRVELAFLEQRSQTKHTDWIPATHDQLRKVEHYLKQKDGIEGGWLALNAARRYMLCGLSKIELAMQAAILREETQKVSSWRGKVMKNVLAVPDDQLTADRVREAMALRDEYAANQYHKVWLMGDQLAVLLKLCGITIPLFLPLIVFVSRHSEDLPPWGYQMVTAVLFFGLLGAAFSVAQSLIKDTNQSRIMERVANHFVTIARTLFGAVAGLAGYAFLESKALNITIGKENSIGGALAIAFLFGYAGERLIASVAGTFSSNKP